MLYCPKCQRKYEPGTQRFCNSDGGRLMPVVNSGVKRETQSQGVFTNLLAQTSKRYESDENLAAMPRFVKTENREPEFEVTAQSRVFKSEQKINQPRPEPPAEPAAPPKTVTEKKPETTAKPLSRLIRPREVRIDQAELGDRTVKPAGRLALTWQNPRILLGQTVKGRYFITQKLEQDFASIAYLAKDKIRDDKNVIVRILMEQNTKDDFLYKLLAEERVSLAHIDHPNVIKVVDSGELPEGKPFIVTEYVENESVLEHLKKSGAINPMRAARIIRQASLALNEVHQNGILHRNLQPQHLLLTVSEAGNEIVKVSDFCISDGKITKENFTHKAPEQINGQLPTFASDSYSLAVIAYQLLTNRLPFNPATERELYKSQKQGLNVDASHLNPDLNPRVDEILTRALAFNPSDRYPKARDFGEAVFNALTTSALWAETADEPAAADFPASASAADELPVMPLAGQSEDVSAPEITVPPKHTGKIATDIHIDSYEADIEIGEFEEIESDPQTAPPVSIPKDSLWEKRSPEPAKERSGLWLLWPVLGLVVLFSGVFGIWKYFRSVEDARPETAVQSPAANRQAQGVDSVNKNPAVSDEEIETPPGLRNLETPPGFAYFENSIGNLSPELAKSFRGFSISYPEDWKLKKFDRNENKVDDKFLDIAKETSGGIPIESFMISPYDSYGTFSKDKKIFPKLVAKSNEDLAKSLNGNYEVVSEGETTIQNGRWKAYQVNFRTKEKGEVNGRQIELWGRRLWIPVQRPGVKNGFIITMFATSLAEDITSADDVGKKGELAKILETFEPDQNY
jgi:serine/threonine protein kinase